MRFYARFGRGAGFSVGPLGFLLLLPALVAWWSLKFAVTLAKVMLEGLQWATAGLARQSRRKE